MFYFVEKKYFLNEDDWKWIFKIKCQKAKSDPNPENKVRVRTDPDPEPYHSSTTDTQLQQPLSIPRRWSLDTFKTLWQIFSPERNNFGI
jgi:hypothetical protein